LFPIQDRKNALEEYVYDMRSKLDDRYALYVQPEEKQKLLAALQEAENWLYSEEGEDATKSAYVARLDALKALGDPIVIRYREAEERPAVIAQLREALNDYMAKATSGDEKYSHIDEKDKQSIVEKAVTIQQWLDDQVARQAERPKHADPVLRIADISKKRDEIIYFATPILSKPKLKPVIPPNTGTPNGANTPGTGTPRTDTPDPSASTKADGPKPEGTKPEDAKPDGSKSTRPPEMDVD
jgi:heat shock protein 4